MDEQKKEEVELPPFEVGEKIPLKGRWFAVSKVGMTENGVAGLVLEQTGFTHNEAIRRKNLEQSAS